MEETQALDFADYPLEDAGTPDVSPDQVVGELRVVSEPVDNFAIYLGLNVVGRGSSQADHDEMLDKWKADYIGMPVHGVFLQNASISSTHAAIYVESAGAVCWIKDLGSRNKTMLGRAGGLTVLQSKGDRYSVLQGDKLRFGSVDTIITYSTVPEQARTSSHAQAAAAAAQHTDQQATEPQGFVGRSPTPDMAAQQALAAPSAPVPNTDNDMTLPWDDPLDHQQDYLQEGNSNSRPAAVSHDTQAFEPMFADTQVQAPAPTVLPETQFNGLPADMPPASALGSAQQTTGLTSVAAIAQMQTVPDSLSIPMSTPLTTLGLPNVPVAEPTKLVAEPAQLAIPVPPSAAPTGALSGSQAGTALASAASQAMTGAQPTQASLLPSSAGFSTGMPSLAAANGASDATQADASRRAGAASHTASMSAISRPEADAVLHLPSQPSGSQHAAHPHGPPRPTQASHPHNIPPKPPTLDQPAGRMSQSQQRSQAADAAAAAELGQAERQQASVTDTDRERSGGGMSADISGRNSMLLDSVLGHDDDDSIWMPPACLPESEGPLQAEQPTILPTTGGQDLPLQPRLPSPGVAEGAVDPAASAEPAGYVSDSDQTQDSQPEEQKQEAEVQQQGETAAVKSSMRQGRRGLALASAPAEEGMYTGAFAFPDSASLPISQPAMELPEQAGTKAPSGNGASQGRAAAAKALPQGRAAAAKALPQGRAAVANALSQGRAAPPSATTAAPRCQDVAASAVAQPAPQGRAAPAPTTAAAAAAAEPSDKGTAVSAEWPKVAAPAKVAAGATSGSRGAGRAVPAAWKSKKAHPLPDLSEHTSTGTPQDDVQPAPAEVTKPPTKLAQPIVHEADSVSPWRVRGTPLGAGPGPSQAPDSEDINAAMAAAGDMAAFFPSTQLEPEAEQPIVADSSAKLPSSSDAVGNLGQNNKAGSQASSGDSQNYQVPAAAQAEEALSNQIPAAARRGAYKAQQVDASLAAKNEGNDHVEGLKTAKSSHELQAEQEVAPQKAAVKGKGRPKVNMHAADDEKKDKAKGSAGRGQSGQSAGGRGGRQGTGRKGIGRRTAKKSAAAEVADVTAMDLDEGEPKVATKAKRHRSNTPEPSPQLQATRVSKRQKAKADTEAAAAAQQDRNGADGQAEEENQQEDPFSGAATQAAAGALEELRRSATPDIDSDEEAAVPVLLPIMKGRRSKTTRAAPASASRAPASGQTQAKRRASAKGRATASTAEDRDLTAAQSSRDGSGDASASGQSNESDGTIAAGQDNVLSRRSRSSRQADVQQKQTLSGSKARGKSRLSKASSPAEPTETKTAAAELPVKHTSSDKQPQAGATQPAAEANRKSGTGSTVAQTKVKQTIAADDTQLKQQVSKAEQAAAGQDANLGEAAAAKGGRAKQKSALIACPADASAASRPAARSSKRASRSSHGASQGVECTPAVASASVHAVTDAAPDGKARRGRGSGTSPTDISQGEAARPVEEQAQAQPSRLHTATEAAASGPVKGPGLRAKRGRSSASAPQEISQLGKEEEQHLAGPSSGAKATGPAGEAAARGTGVKTNKGKRSRQDLTEAEDEGPASQVKAARKGTETKQVRVLYSTTLDKSLKASMTKIIKRLGGSVEDKEGPDFTHFVTLQPTAAGQADRGFKKSINALIALAAGRPIVGDSWVNACGRSKSFVDPVDHLLIDSAAHKKFGFDMRTSYERAQHHLLLKGLHVFFTPGMLAGETDKGANIKNLVGHAGGIVADQLPKTVSGEDTGLSSQWLLIAHEKDSKKEQKWCNGKVGSGLHFYGRTMLIDSIMQQSLDRKHGVLFTT